MRDSDLVVRRAYAQQGGWVGRMRDKIAWRLANAALMVATPWYRAMIGGAIRYGLDAAAKDAEAERNA